MAQRKGNEDGRNLSKGRRLEGKNLKGSKKEWEYHKLHSACISTTSILIFTNQVVLEHFKWGLFINMQNVQKWQQTTEILGH